ncbi:hypothetical protein Tco_0298410 [Tanacetum coccineum]
MGCSTKGCLGSLGLTIKDLLVWGKFGDLELPVWHDQKFIKFIDLNLPVIPVLQIEVCLFKASRLCAKLRSRRWHALPYTAWETNWRREISEICKYWAIIGVGALSLQPFLTIVDGENYLFLCEDREGAIKVDAPTCQSYHKLGWSFVAFYHVVKLFLTLARVTDLTNLWASL